MSASRRHPRMVITGRHFMSVAPQSFERTETFLTSRPLSIGTPHQRAADCTGAGPLADLGLRGDGTFSHTLTRDQSLEAPIAAERRMSRT
jgi:hypothetical protein